MPAAITCDPSRMRESVFPIPGLPIILPKLDVIVLKMSKTQIISVGTLKKPEMFSRIYEFYSFSFLT